MRADKTVLRVAMKACPVVSISRMRYLARHKGISVTNEYRLQRNRLHRPLQEISPCRVNFFVLLFCTRKFYFFQVFELLKVMLVPGDCPVLAGIPSLGGIMLGEVRLRRFDVDTHGSFFHFFVLIRQLGCT